MTHWNLTELFNVSDDQRKRISEIVTGIDELATDPQKPLSRIVNTNEDHLLMWLITAITDASDQPHAAKGLPRLDMPITELFQLWQSECDARKRITEIERSACTILMRTIGMIGGYSQTGDERVVRWIHRLCTHANWYWWGPEGVHSNGNSWELKLFDYASYYAGNPNVERLVAYSRMVDDSLMNLGGAVASYRSDGRPSGDQTTSLDRMSGITVTSSLAAAVAEFHAGMMNAQWHRYND